MSLKNFEAKWKTALTSILEQLNESEFKKMLFYLEKIPQGVKAGKVREEMAQIIIQYLGPEDSIPVVNKAMDQIPRKDAAVQDLLRPFVDKLKTKRQKIKEEKKSKPASETGLPAAQQTSSQPDKKTKQKGSSQPATKAAAKKVVQTSAPSTSQKKRKVQSGSIQDGKLKKRK